MAVIPSYVAGEVYRPKPGESRHVFLDQADTVKIKAAESDKTPTRESSSLLKVVGITVDADLHSAGPPYIRWRIDPAQTRPAIETEDDELRTLNMRWNKVFTSIDYWTQNAVLKSRGTMAETGDVVAASLHAVDYFRDEIEGGNEADLSVRAQIDGPYVPAWVLSTV